MIWIAALALDVLPVRMRPTECSRVQNCPTVMEIGAAVRQLDQARYDRLQAEGERNAGPDEIFMIHPLRFNRVKNVHCADEPQAGTAVCKFTAIWGKNTLEHTVATFRKVDQKWSISQTASVVQKR